MAIVCKTECIQTEAIKAADDVKVTPDRDGDFCGVENETEEIVNYLNITVEHGRLLKCG
jgi:hypothetical protein